MWVTIPTRNLVNLIFSLFAVMNWSCSANVVQATVGISEACCNNGELRASVDVCTRTKRLTY